MKAKCCDTCKMFYLYMSRGNVCPYMPCKGGMWVRQAKKGRK